MGIQNVETEDTDLEAAPEMETEDEAAEMDSEGAEGGDLDSEGDSSAEEGEGAVVMEIGGERKTFASNEEALAWARQNIDALTTERAVSEAYRAGVLDAQVPRSQGAPAPQAETEDDLGVTDEDFYRDPTGSLRKVKNRAKQEAIAEVSASAATRAADEHIWEQFCQAHPDLADFRTDVEAVANSPIHRPNIEALAQTKGLEAAMAYTAQKARAKFQQYMEKAKPTTTLPRGKGGGPTPTGSARKSVTLPEKPKKVLSMSEQVRQARMGKR